MNVHGWAEVQAACLLPLDHLPAWMQVKHLSQPGVTDSFRQFHVEQLAADIKETTCRVSDVRFSTEENVNIPTVSYEARPVSLRAWFVSICFAGSILHADLPLSFAAAA